MFIIVLYYNIYCPCIFKSCLCMEGSILISFARCIILVFMCSVVLLNIYRQLVVFRICSLLHATTIVASLRPL